MISMPGPDALPGRLPISSVNPLAILSRLLFKPVLPVLLRIEVGPFTGFNGCESRIGWINEDFANGALPGVVATALGIGEWITADIQFLNVETAGSTPFIKGAHGSAGVYGS